MKFQTKTEKETRDLGKRLAQNFLKSEKTRKQALVISLEGELGSGKTTFVQGLAQKLGVTNWIKSPTFILMREHVISPNTEKSESEKNYGLTALIHIDCYRLTKPEALLEIGLRDILKDRNNIILIEWGEKVSKFLPKKTIRIKFKHLKQNQREITIL